MSWLIRDLARHAMGIESSSEHRRLARFFRFDAQDA
jgi:hypothetical protein